MDGIQRVIQALLELFQLEQECRSKEGIPALNPLRLEPAEGGEYLLRASGGMDTLGWLVHELSGQWEIDAGNGVFFLLKSTVVLVEWECSGGRRVKKLFSYPGKDPGASGSGKALLSFFRNLLGDRGRTFRVTTLIQQ